ncbi:GGDEF domain-containing protein [Cytobacillus suaedae]|nr:GGDEF domain-containing protein [Cytobacillus suaedae]
MPMDSIGYALTKLDSVIWKYGNSKKFEFLSGFPILEEFFSDDDIRNGSISILSITHPSDKTTLLRCIQSIQTDQSFSDVLRLKNKSNVYKWVKITGYSFTDDKNHGCFIGQALDYSDQVNKEQAVKTLQNQMMAILDSVPNPAAIHKEEKIVYINPAALHMLRLTKTEEALGKRMEDFVSPNNKDILIGSDGSEREIVAMRFPILFNDETHYLSFGNDITEQRKVKERLENLEYFDELTTLPNYKSFNEKLTSYIEYTNVHFSVFFISINELKLIHTTFGYQVGDEILKTIAIRLKKALGKENNIFRVEGDKFSYIGQGQTKEQCSEIAKKITKLITEPVFINGHEFYISPSIGITLFPEDGKDKETLKKNTNAALYLASDKDHHHFQFYDSLIKEAYIRRVVLEKALRKARKNNEFYLVFQPKCCIKTGEVIGAEALLRWRHPEFGIVSPTEFIEIAEESGIIDSIGEWVLIEACHQVRKWKDIGLDIKISVNLSVKQLHHPNLVKIVRNALERADISSSNLELEITESIMQQPNAANRLLHKLKNLGITISIDDFGTGYSSLSYLKNLPIDTLKIDRSFIKDIEAGERDRAIVKSIVELGHNLNLHVVAEGVETKGQLHYLNKIHCNYAQGFLYSKPLNPEDFVNWMKNRVNL